MTLTLEIPPETDRQLLREAQLRGVAVTDLAVHLLVEAVGRGGKLATERRRAPEDVRAWIESLAEFSDQMPKMPGETFSRKMLYSDHD